MINSMVKAYSNIMNTALSGREADAQCFKLLIDDLKKAETTNDFTIRQEVLGRHQNLWSMIMQVNALDVGVTPEEDRQLFVRLADQVQRYGIRAILNSKLSLAPLIEVAENVYAGLTNTAETLGAYDDKSGEGILF
ncbi:MAG: hypothetical protein J6P29_04375 [Acetobacter sp.]|nr:hypothetical protein [Acetobacter sp.]